jgi:hypothetical protein
MIDFGNYCKSVGLMDKNVTTSTLDRLFISTNVELVEMDDNPDKSLQRFELLEIMIRISGAKYKDVGGAVNYADGLKKILDGHIKPHSDGLLQGQNFREKYIWTLKINDILYANLLQLQKVI